MPKNQVSDPITDQEIAFAHMVLSGTVTDRRAAEAVGLNPDTAAYTKAKPRVVAYMREHRAAMHQQIVQQETEGLRRLDLSREQVLARLWEIANLSHEVTRNSISAQLKALSLIIAIEGLIPDHRAGSPEKKPASPAPRPQIYRAARLANQQEKATGPESGADQVPEDDEPGVPSPGAATDAPAALGSAPIPDAGSGNGIITHQVSSAETTPPASHAPVSASVPDRRVPFSIRKNSFARRQ